MTNKLTWNDIIQEESNKEYFIKLSNFIQEERKTKNILPSDKDIFNAFNLTPLENIKVVIIGQDPYPTANVPMGLAFSVNKNIKVPMSLKNIYKELSDEFPNDFIIPNHGDLSNWARKGVFLLNQILTVEEGKPLSHKNIGWETFIKRIISEINNQNQKIVYLLWGNVANKIKPLITNPNHLILETSHPSPLSARVSFFGSNIFIKTNNYLGLSNDFWKL